MQSLAVTVFCSFLGLFVLAGLGLAVRGLMRMSATRALDAAGYRAVGVVVDNELTSHDDGVSFRPVVEFRTAEGADVAAVVDQPRSRSYLVGSSVEVVYDPDRPTRVDLAVGYRSAGVMSVVAGVVFAGFAGAALVFVLSESPREPQFPEPRFPGLPTGAPQFPTFNPNGIPLPTIETPPFAPTSGAPTFGAPTR